MKTRKFNVFSPDGFSIHMTDTYKSPEAAHAALLEWKKRYEAQGYYSTGGNRIPLNVLELYCTIAEINKKTFLYFPYSQATVHENSIKALAKLGVDVETQTYNGQEIDGYNYKQKEIGENDEEVWLLLPEKVCSFIDVYYRTEPEPLEPEEKHWLADE